MIAKKKINQLKNKALDLRRKTLKMFVQKGEAHLGGSFSMIEIVLSLFSQILKKNDKFILSKSHASFPLCIILKEKGLNQVFSPPILPREGRNIISAQINAATGFPGNPNTYLAPNFAQIKGLPGLIAMRQLISCPSQFSNCETKSS